MHKLTVPNEVKISELRKKGSLSTNNYKRLSIKNNRQRMIRDFLVNDKPYDKGVEPGSSAYVSKSKQFFLRNSCINTIQFSTDKSKYISLNPNYYNNQMVQNEDVLFCTDANIGDCCLFISDNENVMFSSGIVKLNFKEEKYKYYVAAFMRDGYFREQLNVKTPKGSTIRHSGDLFLECLIPYTSEEWVYLEMETLIKNISYSEYFINLKLRKSEQLMDQEFNNKHYNYVNPSIKQLINKGRLDSSIYSNTVFQWKNNIKNYKNGFCNLYDFGFELKRGPNLAKRDLGRSIQQDSYRKGYSVLIYPSDISLSGYIQKVSYLGARNPIWFLGKRDILFSTEGTVGKTFIVCDENMHFTTNFHGTIVHPVDENVPLNKSIFLGLYLNYLRYKGIFECMSVGANGGSFAVGYWDNILIPKADETFISDIANLYNSDTMLDPNIFDTDKISQVGIYQLNNFLIRCKNKLSILCNDIKNNSLKSKEYYMLTDN